MLGSANKLMIYLWENYLEYEIRERNLSKMTF